MGVSRRYLESSTIPPKKMVYYINSILFLFLANQILYLLWHKNNQTRERFANVVS